MLKFIRRRTDRSGRRDQKAPGLGFYIFSILFLLSLIFVAFMHNPSASLVALYKKYDKSK